MCHLYCKPMESRIVNESKGKAQALDDYLVSTAQLGDRKSMAALVLRWNRKLLAHARRLLGDSEAAADAVQEAWTEILRGLDNLREPRAFPAWAYRIVSRRCARTIGQLRGHRRMVQAVSAEPVEAVEAQETAGLDIDRLRAAIRQLPGDQRAAIALFYFEDMSVAEVAVSLDIPAGTVKTRLMHARRKLRAMFEGELS